MPIDIALDIGDRIPTMTPIRYRGTFSASDGGAGDADPLTIPLPIPPASTDLSSKPLAYTSVQTLCHLLQPNSPGLICICVIAPL